VVILSVIGIVYASCIAIVQTDIKRLIAYSSIAHMGLMSAVAFMHSGVGMHGIMVQMFNHGINITGMWLIVSMVEERWGTRDMTKMGGMATVAPRMAIALVIISLANIALRRRPTRLCYGAMRTHYPGPVNHQARHGAFTLGTCHGIPRTRKLLSLSCSRPIY
jgi:NADH:ubiquinone oxidoreductase subunit 5 (subunit L)/multisubunit Na+/H+ antiporter MnhA subunit